MRRVRTSNDLHELAYLVIRGFDGDGDGDGGDSGGDSGGDAGGDDTGTGDGDSGGDDGGDGAGDDDLPDDLEGLKKAIKAERALRKKAERGLKLTEREKKKLEKAQQDIADADKSETEKAKTAQKAADEKAVKLAAKLRQSSLERAIIEVARKQRFRDPDDVITQLQRSNFEGIEIDQDEDDPSEIDIDAKSVEKAVKAVATAKPHWLVAAGDGSPSGSSFGGSRPDGGKDKNAKHKEYGDRFPALRDRIPRS